LGAEGLNPIAVAKIFEAKKRPSFNPLILHISDKSALERYSYIRNDKVNRLINKFWPGPLTLVLPKTNLVPDIVTAGNTTIAIRMPKHPVALQLIKECGSPIAAPSANRFGHLSPTEASHVANYLGPCVARTPNDARGLIAGCLAQAAGARTAGLPATEEWMWDVFPDNAPGLELARQFGFQPVRRLVRMRRGPAIAERPELVYAAAGFELG